MHAAALRYLDAVARYGSIRRAASELNISASAINRQILQLEAALDIELFERRASGMEPTELGEIVIEHARRTLHEFEAVKGEISFRRERLSGNVRIATLDSLTLHVLPQAILAFRRDHPDVSFGLETTGPAGVARLVSNDSADLGLTFGSQVYPGVTVRYTVPANLCAIMRAGHPLAGRSIITAADCKSAEIILQEASAVVGDLLGDEIMEVRRTAKPVLTSDTIVASKACILGGDCVGFFTRFGFIEEIEAGTIVAIPFAARVPSTLTMATIVSSTRRASRAVDAFVDHLSGFLDRVAVESRR